MYNILLDGFPTEYNGYKLNTSYKVGILISMLLQDEEVDIDYKYSLALSWLYDEIPDDFEVAVDGLMWFVSCGTSEVFYIDKPSSTNKNDEKALDYQVDSLEIYGTFRTLGIDLVRQDIHWFEFVAILRSLPDCSLTKTMGYRTMDLSDFRGKQRAFYQDLKNRLRVRKPLTKEEYEQEMAKSQKNYGSYYERLARINSGG